MVNAAATETTTTKPDRRERSRAGAADHAVLGQGKLNPFGDLNTLQHVCARLARTMRTVWEPLLRQETRCWAEPLAVQRFADYRAERPDRLTAWQPLAMAPGAGGAALLVVDGGFLLELLDRFFGGAGAAPQPLPAEFTPAAEALVARIAATLAGPLKAAWEPLSKVDFTPGRLELQPASLAEDAEAAVIVTRFGIGAGDRKPVFVDLVYPVAALKPHGAALTGKVVDKAAPDAAWRNMLTRSVMQVAFPVRSVLAEPVVPLQTLIDLKPGDVIPIAFGAEVPVMVGRDRLGVGTVGTANGRAAIRLTRIARDEGPAR